MNNNKLDERNILVRILCSVFWFFTIIIVGQILLGIILGGYVGTEGPSGGFEAGQAAADQVDMVIKQKLGGLIYIVYLIEISIFWALLKFEILPGTSKYKYPL